jgi:putative restriction endonuclease
MEDEHLRSACFARLQILEARFGTDIPYRGGLNEGFPFVGERVPFLSPQKGIFRARVQQGAAALSINTSAKSPYADREIPDGFLYAYRAGAIDQPDNRALRAAFATRTPIVYFRATKPGWYCAVYPCYVTSDDPGAGFVVVTPGKMVGEVDSIEPEPLEDVLERTYKVREQRVRLHQAVFRRHVLDAYAGRCTICRLREMPLLDAAHITGDLEEKGDPVIANGLSLCSIHHRAFDQDLVGVSPEYEVHVSSRLLEDEDGPMLELLKGFHRQPIALPARHGWHPDRDRLAERFDRFATASP